MHDRDCNGPGRANVFRVDVKSACVGLHNLEAGEVRVWLRVPDQRTQRLILPRHYSVRGGVAPTAAFFFGSIDSPVAGGRGRGAAAPPPETAEEKALQITKPPLSPETAHWLWRHYLGDEIAGRLRAGDEPGH